MIICNTSDSESLRLTLFEISNDEDLLPPPVPPNVRQKKYRILELTPLAASFRSRGRRKQSRGTCFLYFYFEKSIFSKFYSI